MYRTVYHPLILQSLLWIVYYLILSANIDKYDVTLSNINPFIVLQALGFSAGGFIAVLFTKTKVKQSRQIVDDEVFETAKSNVVLLYPLALTILIASVIYAIKQIGSTSILEIMNFRNELAEDDGKKMGSIGILQLLLSVYVLIYAISVKHKQYKWGGVKLTLLVGSFLYLVLLLGSKGMFVAFFSALAYILLYQRLIKKRIIVLFFIFLSGIIFLLLFLRGETNEGAVDKDSFIDLLLIYSVTTLPALYLMKEHQPLIFGYYTFRIPYIWLNKLGYQFPVSPMLNEFTLAPLPGNVYSYLKPYYYDFGMTGIFIIPMFIAAFHTIIFYRSTQKKIQYLFFNAMFIYPLIMQIFEENYFRQMTNWVYIFITIYILTKINLYDSRNTFRKLQPQTVE